MGNRALRSAACVPLACDRLSALGYAGLCVELCLGLAGPCLSGHGWGDYDFVFGLHAADLSARGGGFARDRSFV